MKFPGYKILEELRNSREISFYEAAKLLPIHYGDHRDFYPLASLFAAGYISANFDASNLHDNSDPNLFLASFFYATTRGEGRHSCNMFTAINSAETVHDSKIFITAKGDLLFAGQRQKQLERLYTIGISILVGATSSIITLVVKSWFSD